MLRLLKVLFAAHLVGLLLTVVDAIFLLQKDGNVLTNTHFSTGEVMSLLFVNFYLSVALSVVLIAFLSSSYRIIRALGILMLGAGVFVYITSWQMYSTLHHFLDLEGASFFAHNPWQIVLHLLQLNVTTVLIFLSIGFVSFLALTFGTRKFLEYVDRLILHPRFPRKTFVFSSILLLALSIGGIFSTYDKKVSIALRNKLSPQSTVVMDLMLSNIHSETVEQEQTTKFYAWNKQLPLSDYASEAAPFLRAKPVIYIVVESLRSDVLNDDTIMPNLYRFAQESLQFQEGYTTSTHSDYADLAIVSSHYPLRSTRHHYYPKDIKYPRVLIYDVLKELGYHTGLFSAQNESWGNMRNYLDTGNLDIFFDATSDSAVLYKTERDTGFANWFKNKDNAGKVDDGVVIDHAKTWVNSLEEKAPFFLSLNFQRSHFPYSWPETFDPPFEPHEMNFRVRFAYYPKDKIDIMRNRYFNSLAYIDKQLGKLFSFLQEKGLFEESIIVITGDTGQAFYEHDYATHAGPLFNEVLAVPILIRAPDLKPSKPEHITAQHVDIVPTTFDLLGLPQHPAFQGVNLLGLSDLSKRPLFFVAQTGLSMQDGILLENWKLIVDHKMEEHLLFNLSEDPGEKNNVVEQHPKVHKYLKRHLRRWRKTQLSFYGTKNLHRNFYPPRYLSPERSVMQFLDQDTKDGESEDGESGSVALAAQR